MRDLVEFITERYEDTDQSFKPISSRPHALETHHARYNIETNHTKPGELSTDHTGVTHRVDWEGKMVDTDSSQKIRTVSDAKNLHNHALQNNFKTGDVVKNIPAKDNPKLKKLYRRAGFGDNSPRWNAMLSIVRTHPHDHEEESKRGQNYLEPLHHDVVNAHRGR